GLLVANVQANSLAAAAGIKAGDIIADAENTRLNTLRDFGKLLLDKVPGQTLDRVSVHRLKDGRLTEDAEIIETLQIEWRTSKRQHSMTVSAGPAKMHLEHGITVTRDPDGACRVQTVAADSAADRAGIQTGDRIELFAMRKCGSPEEFDRLWKAAAGDTVPVLVRRGEDRPLYITLPKTVSNTNRRHVGNTTTEISAAY
ncbi:MAG: PDZ domain-containing protein, partial [Pseudomonadota bacterium]